MDRERLIGLIQSSAGGDAQAFSALYEEYYGRIYYLCSKILRNSEDAADIAQETFVSAFENLRSLNNALAFEGWLKTIATNKCKNYLKKSKPILFSQYENDDGGEIDFEDDNSQNVEETADNSDLRRIINDIIDTLPDAQRVCVILYYYDEKSVSEIAEFLECSEGTVKSRLNYARKKIREEVEKIEKRDGVQLHSALILPMLGHILSENTSANIPSALAKTQFSSLVNGAAETAAKASAPGRSRLAGKNRKPASTAKKPFYERIFKTTTQKIIAAAVSATVLVSSGVAAGVNIEKSRNNAPASEAETQITFGEIHIKTIKLLDSLIEGAGGTSYVAFLSAAENAQGYRLKFSNGDTFWYHDIGITDTMLYFSGFVSKKIEICAFAADDNNEIVYGDWKTVYSPNASDDYDTYADISDIEKLTEECYNIDYYIYGEDIKPFQVN